MRSPVHDNYLLWHVIKSTLVLDHPGAQVRRDECRVPNIKGTRDYYYREGGDFVQVFALTHDHELILTKQYQHAVREVVIQLPAFLLNSNEDPLGAAKRELRKVTGFASDIWTDLGVLNISSAKSTVRARIFLAQNA